MPGDHRVEAEVKRLLQQRGELDLLIATHTRVRGAAGAVLLDEVVDDVQLEALGEVPHVVRNADDVGGTLGIHRVLNGAATAASSAESSGHPA